MDMKRLRRALAFSFGVMLLPTASSFARTIFVDSANRSGVEDGSPDHPFNLITKGYCAAMAGDTLIIRAGGSPEHGTFGKAIAIRSEGGTAVLGSQPAPFDLVWDAVDDNCLPKNPKWGWQVTHPSQLPNPQQLCNNEPDRHQCTTQATSRDSGFWCGPHMNWFPSTYEGTLFWDGHAAPGTDDDYNFLAPALRSSRFDHERCARL